MIKDTSVLEPATSEAAAKRADYERYHAELTPEFKTTIEKMMGKNFFSEGERLGVRVYQPKTEFDDKFVFSFSALFEGRMIMFTLKNPTKDQKKDGYKATVQPDFIFLDDYLEAIKKAEFDGDFAGWADRDKMTAMYLRRSEGLHPSTLSFGRGMIRLLVSIDKNTQVITGTHDQKEYDLYVKLFEKFGNGARNFVLYPPSMTT